MYRLLAVAMAIMVILNATMPACSVPDEGSIEGFLQKIRAMDAGAGKAARIAEARERALDALRRERHPSDRVGRVNCIDGVGNGASMPVYVSEIVACLVSTSQLTFADCVEARFADISSNYVGANAAHGKHNASCKYEADPSFAVDQKWDPDQITEEDLARSAFGSPSAPPAWMIAAGVVAIGAGGVFVFASGWGLVLCPLDLEYGCPGDPLNPGADPAQGSSSSGGDR